jgi:MFS family permease
MGLGAVASEPGTLSMLRHLYPEERSRSRAIGVWVAVSGLALAVGPVLGRVLVGLRTWRAIFWFNLAFGLAARAAAAVILPESADPEARRVDTAGALLGAAGPRRPPRPAGPDRPPRRAAAGQSPRCSIAWPSSELAAAASRQAARSRCCDYDRACGAALSAWQAATPTTG